MNDTPTQINSYVGLAFSLPRDGRIAFGTWQGIYLIEHRDRGHRREIVLSAVGA